MAKSEDFVDHQQDEKENVTFVDDMDPQPTEAELQEQEADRKRLFWRLQNPKFIAWVKAKGCDPKSATSQMVNEFDAMELGDIRRRSAKSRSVAKPRRAAKSRPVLRPAPPENRIEVDRMDPDEWEAGADEWIREGHELETVPLEGSKWKALIGRRIARLARENEVRAKARRQDLRRRTINSLKPPKLPEVELDGKSILVAEQAYQKRRQEMLAVWNLRFRELPRIVAQVWELFHEAEGDDFDNFVYLKPRQPSTDEYPADLRLVEKGLTHPAYGKFQRYNAAILQELEAVERNFEEALNPPPNSRPLFKAWSIREINENDGSAWPVPGVIPRGVTFLYGAPKECKSLWVQNLSVCTAGVVPFDEIDNLEHGRVLYVSRDIGASRQEVKKRLMEISLRRGLSENALDDKLLLTDDPLHLDDHASVDNLLVQNPGPFTLVVIDSLFRCVSGSLTQDNIASAAAGAFDKISRVTGAGVVVVHHQPRNSEQLFGSIMLDATYDAKLHVERAKDRNFVTVSVQELKNAPISVKALTYRIEGAYLAPASGVGAIPLIPAKSGVPRHQEMLALFPDGWFPRKEGRKLVEHLLTGSPEARRKQWQRAVAAMEDAGEVEVKRNSMRKM